MLQQNFKIEGNLTILKLDAWMDGGSLTIITNDKYLNTFEIEITQYVDLEKRKGQFNPRSLVLNDIKVDVRSTLENQIILALNKAIYADNIDEIDKHLISEGLNFVQSEKYIDIARKLARIK